MALAERAKSPQRVNKRCKFGLLYEQLPKDDQAWLDDQMANRPGMNQRMDEHVADALMDEFKESGLFISWITVSRHRKQKCGCYK